MNADCRLERGRIANRVTTAIILLVTAAACDKPSDDSFRADKLISQLKQVSENAEIGEAHETPIQGLIGVKVGGGNVVYGTADGRYIVAGDLFALESSGLVNLTERLRKADRKAVVNALDPATTITYAPDDVNAVITVFTDVSCWFCRELHAHIDQLLNEGIEVRYAAFPRRGIGSGVYTEMVSVWCADDRQEALTKAKLGESVAALDCSDHPVDNHYRLGRVAGIAGTPGILLPDGRYIAGFTTVGELLADVVTD